MLPVRDLSALVWTGQLILPETLKHLPIYTLAMLAGDAFTNEGVVADRRAAAVVEAYLPLSNCQRGLCV